MSRTYALPQRLVTQIAEGNVVLFLGAGVSLDSGAPTVAALSKGIVDHFLGASDADYDLADAAALAEAVDGRRQLNNWILQQLEGLNPSDSLRAIPTFRWHAVYTTNYDDLLEQAYESSPAPLQKLHPIYSNRDPVSTLRPDEVPLYKLHGCISRANAPEGHLVLTQDDFARVEASRQRLFNRLLDSVADRPVLYIGFSRRDPDFARVLAAVEQAIGNFAQLSRSYALQPGYVDAEQKRAETKKVTLIDLGADEFFTALQAAIPAESRVPSDQPAAASLSRLTMRRPMAKATTLSPVLDDFEILDDVLTTDDSDPSLFFKGSAPSWGDIAQGFDAKRDLQDEVTESVLVDVNLDQPGVTFVLLHAEAGAGKTTLLRRVGTELALVWDAVVLS